MHLWLYKTSFFLAQALPWEDADRPDPTPPAKKAISFSDLQQGLRAYNNGETTSNYFRYGLIGMVVIVVLFAILLNLRQRRKEGAPPDSAKKLAAELARKIHFPLSSRLILNWVARTANVPMPTLLISAKAFDAAVHDWREKNTFALARRWAAKKITALRPTLFE